MQRFHVNDIVRPGERQYFAVFLIRRTRRNLLVVRTTIGDIVLLFRPTASNVPRNFLRLRFDILEARTEQEFCRLCRLQPCNPIPTTVDVQNALRRYVRAARRRAADREHRLAEVTRLMLQKNRLENRPARQNPHVVRDLIDNNLLFMKVLPDGVLRRVDGPGIAILPFQDGSGGNAVIQAISEARHQNTEYTFSATPRTCRWLCLRRNDVVMFSGRIRTLERCIDIVQHNH